MVGLSVSEINIYPIKSTAGIPLEQARVTAKGLALDRRWMLVDPQGKAITGREYPALTLVRARVTDGALEVHAPGMAKLRLHYEAADHELVDVQIWGDDCTAMALSLEVDRWFSDYLGAVCRLVRMSDAHPRGVDPDSSRPGDIVSFADAFPVLLISEASLGDLNARLSQPVSMRRFRPNIVVSGGTAFAEDRWRRVRIGDVTFEGVKNCPRCSFTTIDPDTSSKHPDQEPLRTLGTYRRGPDGGVLFGRNLIPRQEGVIRLSDPLELLGT